MSNGTVRRGSLAIVLAAGLMVPVTQASAALSSYSQNFESLNAASGTALGDSGWLIFANVFNPNLSYAYGYGVFPAPNNAGGFSAVATGQGGPAQGAQQLSVYSDYNNQGAHTSGQFVEANVFQERTIGAADVGSTWIFTFDAKRGNLESPTTALAFIKTLDQNNGYATTSFLTVDTSAIPTSWGTYSTQITITPALSGQILQFGFASTATLNRGSGVFYDNINFAIPAPAALPVLAMGGLMALRRRRN